MNSSRSRYPTPPASSGSHSPIYTTLEVTDTNGITELTNNVGSLLYASMDEGPYLEILEQPVDKFRFRYKSEMSGTHGSLSGRTTVKSRKPTFPTVKLWNFDGPAIIRCSLFTYSKEAPIDCRQPHPHRLVRKHDADELIDPHDFGIDATSDFTVVFRNMGIIHTAKKHINTELIMKKKNLKREEIHLLEGYDRPLKISEERDIQKEIHEVERSLDLNTVCLRFDAFKKLKSNALQPLCEPIYSNPIYNLKSAMTGDLKIIRMDACTSHASGNEEIYLLVEKVAKKNIKVQFFEMDEENNTMLWMADAKFRENDVHHQYAIVIRTPPYKDTKISEPVENIYIQLFRPSDNETSDPKPFTYYPDAGHKRKRGRFESPYSSGSSSLNAGETIVPPIVLHHNNPEMCSDELKKYAGNVDSTEFRNLLPDIESLFGEPMPQMNTTPQIISMPLMNSMSYDAPASRQPANALLKVNEMCAIKKQWCQINAYVKTAQPHLEQMLRIKFDELYVNGNNIFQLCYINDLDESSQKLRKLLIELIKKHKLYDLITLENNDNETVLHMCIKKGAEHNYLSELPLENIDVEFMLGFSLMHSAILHNYGIEELCTRLSRKIVNQVDSTGLTPFQYAVGKGRLNAVKVLVAHGAKINAQDNRTGNNVLHQAIKNGDVAMVKFLVQNTPINQQHRNYEGLDCLACARNVLEGDKLNAVYALLCPNANEMDFHTEIQVKEEEESDSDEEMEIKLEDIVETELQSDEDIIVEDIPSDFYKVLRTLSYEKEVIEQLYVDLKFGYLLEIEGVGKERRLDLLIRLALTHNVHWWEIYKVLEAHGLTEAMTCIKRLQRNG